MSAFSWPCQVALKTVLLTVTAVAGRVYDMPPQADGIFPMIQIGDSDAVPDDSSSSTVADQSDDGMIESIELLVWGRAHDGKMVVKQIADEIHERLHGQDIHIAGRATALTWVRRIHTEIMPDGVTTRATISIDVVHRT